MERIPKKLGKEPLIDAVFEVRFESGSPVSSLLPGLLFSKLPGEKSLERLPTSDLPAQLRLLDPNLQFAPLTRLHWGAFLVLIGDRSIALACKLPYAGWEKFKPAITELFGTIAAQNIVASVQRVGMKYVDLIPSDDLSEQVGFTDINVSLGGHKLLKEIFQFRIEIQEDGFTNAIQIANSAVVNLLDGSTRSGLIVDIDTTKPLDGIPMNDFMGQMPDMLENIHRVNKLMFFRCLRDETIKRLEAKYE